MFIICPNCARLQLFLVPHNFLVFCCSRRCWSSCKHCSKGSQAPACLTGSLKENQRQKNPRLASCASCPRRWGQSHPKEALLWQRGYNKMRPDLGPECSCWCKEDPLCLREVKRLEGSWGQQHCSPLTAFDSHHQRVAETRCPASLLTAGIAGLSHFRQSGRYVLNTKRVFLWLLVRLSSFWSLCNVSFSDILSCFYD